MKMLSFKIRSRTFEGIYRVSLTFMCMIPATAAFIRSRFHKLIGSTGVRSHTIVMTSKSPNNEARLSKKL